MAGLYGGRGCGVTASTNSTNRTIGGGVAGCVPARRAGDLRAAGFVLLGADMALTFGRLRRAAAIAAEGFGGAWSIHVSNRAAFFWTPFLAMSAAAVGIAAWSAGGRSADYKFFDELVEVKLLLSTRYVDEVDDKKLREGAIRGMVEALEDPYTVY